MGNYVCHEQRTKDFTEESLLYVYLSTTKKADKLFIFTLLFNTNPISEQTISYSASVKFFS